jgi:hypothetical protein
VAAGPAGDAGSSHAARAQTSADRNAMRCRIVTTSGGVSGVTG